MIKAIAYLVFILLFSGKILAQPGGKRKAVHNKNFKCTAGWSSCIQKGLFSSHNICYHTKSVTVIYNNNWGMPVCKVNPGKSAASIKTSLYLKTNISFSFENFASCLIYLNFKNFKLKIIQNAFGAFKLKYVNRAGLVAVTIKDYTVFQKQYMRYIKTLTKKEKSILKDYIAFFEGGK
ncbi:MAG: hypothetical protein IPJ81_17495 [Chitinophagaceae bacterium]|nr:hypothetical protein [Chitinophagaceae bacterium]